MIEPHSTINRRYRVETPLGAGGMAVVYRAHDLRLGRDVALKALRPQHAADPVFRARFEREASAAAGFSHPNIIRIFDVGLAGETPFFVMELIDGQSLKEIIREEAPFHPDDVAALLAQVGAALDYAHERGYVHRDIKPQNILVDRRGVARVVDFGIAKGIGDLDLTLEGSSLGSVHYLSPEQASGLMPTPASDIYSTGIVAFELLTARLPFTAETPVAVALRHVNEPPPAPSSVLPGIPPAVDAIVLKALAKDPTQRFQRASALATAMQSWREARLPAAARPLDPPPASEPALAIAPPLPPQSPPAAEPPRDDDGDSPSAAPEPPPAARAGPGCASWMVGLAIAILLAALIVAGVQLSGRRDGADPPPSVSGGATEQSAPAGASSPNATQGPTQADAPATGAAGVPDLTGLALSEAATLARQQGLALATAEPVFSETVPVDAVAEQDPPPGAPPPAGGTMYVKVSRGSATIELAPLALAGKPAAVAAATLRAAGFGVTETSLPSESVPAGAVIGTEPGDRATIGSTVTLQVSLGDAVVIPRQLQGQPAAAVSAALTDLGLAVTDEIGVGQSTIEAAGLSLGADGIAAGDVVGVQGENVNFETPLPRGTAVQLVVYDPGLDATP